MTDSTTEPTTDSIWIVIYLGAAAEPRAVADEDGHLLAFDLEEVAMLYAYRLASHGLAARARLTTTSEVIDLLEAHGHELDDDMADHVNVFEAQTLDEQDLERWTLEHADRFAGRLEVPS